jgi:hypothetical protein
MVGDSQADVIKARTQLGKRLVDRLLMANQDECRDRGGAGQKDAVAV